MTAKRKNKTAEVVTSTIADDVKVSESKGKQIAIAVCLPYDLRLDDIPCANGGTKSITLPGINSRMRGDTRPVLALPGNALCVMLPIEDWEAILKVHGRETAFTGRNGAIPCIYPVGDKAGFKAAYSEIREMRTGLEPIEPKAVGVEERKQKGD